MQPASCRTWRSEIVSVAIHKENSKMLSTTRRNFASRVACLFTGLGAANLFSGSAQAASKDKDKGAVRKLNAEGKPADPTALYSPVIVHNGVIYISGQGAHSRDPEGKFPMDA